MLEFFLLKVFDNQGRGGGIFVNAGGVEAIPKQGVGDSSENFE